MRIEKVMRQLGSDWDAAAKVPTVRQMRGDIKRGMGPVRLKTYCSLRVNHEVRVLWLLAAHGAPNPS